MKPVFTYCILGYRVYRIRITIKIITPWLPPDTVTTYSCILTTKNIQKNFQKTVDKWIEQVYNGTIESKHTKRNEVTNYGSNQRVFVQ
jgi:hypothetical protein